MTARIVGASGVRRRTRALKRVWSGPTRTDTDPHGRLGRAAPPAVFRDGEPFERRSPAGEATTRRAPGLAPAGPRYPDRRRPGRGRGVSGRPLLFRFAPGPVVARERATHWEYSALLDGRALPRTSRLGRMDGRCGAGERERKGRADSPEPYSRGRMLSTACLRMMTFPSSVSTRQL